MKSNATYWTPKEDDTLRSLYSVHGPMGMVKHLPRRSLAAISSRARIKGYTFNRHRPYTVEDEKIIREQYPSQGWKPVARLLGRTKTSVIDKASKMGVSSGNKNKRMRMNPQYRGYQDISLSHWNRIVRKATMRDLTMEITVQDAWSLYEAQDKKCSLSGLPISFPSTVTSSDGTASLDRVDSSKGYVNGNVQWVHKDINKMKWDMSQSQFFAYCRLIALKHP